MNNNTPRNWITWAKWISFQKHTIFQNWIRKKHFLLILPPISLYSFFLPSFPFLHPFSLLPSFFFPHSSYSHRWDKKTCSAEKTRVRLCYTHKHQLKTSELRRLRRRHNWILLAFYHRSSYHKRRESEQINLRTVSYTHLTLPTKQVQCRSRWSPYH